MLVAGCWLLVAGCWLLLFARQTSLLVASCYLLVATCYLLLCVVWASRQIPHAGGGGLKAVGQRAAVPFRVWVRCVRCSARGGGWYILSVSAHSKTKTKIKMFWFCKKQFHIHMRPQIRTEPGPFDCARFKKKDMDPHQKLGLP